jgi:hypothetical protein
MAETAPQSPPTVKMEEDPTRFVVYDFARDAAESPESPDRGGISLGSEKKRRGHRGGPLVDGAPGLARSGSISRYLTSPTLLAAQATSPLESDVSGISVGSSRSSACHASSLCTNTHYPCVELVLLDGWPHK